MIGVLALQLRAYNFFFFNFSVKQVLALLSIIIVLGGAFLAPIFILYILLTLDFFYFS